MGKQKAGKSRPQSLFLPEPSAGRAALLPLVRRWGAARSPKLARRQPPAAPQSALKRMDKSRARTSLVRLPMEIRSTPVSAMARTVSRLTPPEASNTARP